MLSHLNETCAGRGAVAPGPAVCLTEVAPTCRTTASPWEGAANVRPEVATE